MLSSRRTLSIIVIAAMFYAVLAVPFSLSLLFSGQPFAVVAGLAVILAPTAAAVSVLRRVRQQRVRELLVAEYTRTQTADADEFEVIDREACEVAVAAQPSNWVAWYRLSVACDHAGDRKSADRARLEALRTHGPWDSEV